MTPEEFFALEVLGNNLGSYAIALVIFFSSILILKIFKFVAIKRLSVLAQKTKNDLDDAIIDAVDQIGWPFYAVLSLFVAGKFLSLSTVLDRIIYYVFLIVLTFYVTKVISNIISYTAGKVSKDNADTNSAIVSLIKTASQAILWIVAVILILDNLGYEITTLLAGVGIGGIAIAFALQNVLADIFASISIFFDKPFRVGDFIIIGQDMGVVEHIGIKTTRIRTLQGQELVVSNQELTSTRVNNYKKMEKRRVVFEFGLVYGTATAKLKKVPNMVKGIITKINKADPDRVHFKKFGDSALIYEVVYYVDSSDYNEFMDIQQEINLGIKESFEKAKIEMAYPTQTIYVKK